MTSSGIRNFYRDSTILITGSTGFVGQLLLEKILHAPALEHFSRLLYICTSLLRVCWLDSFSNMAESRTFYNTTWLHALEPRRVYLLIRKKRNLVPEQRLQSMLNGALFDRVRSSVAVKQLVPVEVDMGREDLGIASEIRYDLRYNVEIVFDLAASVTHVNPLEKSLQENALNAIRLFNLAKDMQNLRSGIFVSTMYSNPERSHIEEKVYTDVGFGGVDALIDLLAKLDDSERQIVAQTVLKDTATYTFAKKCAEIKLQQDFAGLPVGIFRPPGISTIYREPIVGWTNNFYGNTGIMTPLALGIYGTYLLDPNTRMMLAPVDYCASALLLAAVDTNKNFFPGSTTIPVYNYATNDNVPKNRDMVNSYIDGAVGPIKGLFYRNFMNTLAADLNRYLLGVRLMRAHASLVDRMRTWQGQKPIFLKLVDNAVRASLNSQPLGLNNWRVENANVRRMQQQVLDEQEAEFFQCDLEAIDWHEYFRNFIPGIRRHVFAKRIA